MEAENPPPPASGPSSSSSSPDSASELASAAGTTKSSSAPSSTAGTPGPGGAAAAAGALIDPIAFLHVKWDPVDPDKEYPTETAVRRINVEMNDCMRDPVDGIYLALDDSITTVMHALVIGPRETPYEKGFFYFFIRIPSNYPWEPPRVRLMTTGNGKVRFNPNLYNSGKVCLSILGTWPGPSWTAALSVKSVLLSIQSIMNRSPFFNEPAYEGQEGSAIYQSMSEEYTDNIRFETLRVAVLGMMETPSRYADAVNMPQLLKEKMRSIFKENVDFYMKVINDNLKSEKLNYRSLQIKFAKLIEHELGVVPAAVAPAPPPGSTSAGGPSSSKSVTNGTSASSTSAPATTKPKAKGSTKKV